MFYFVLNRTCFFVYAVFFPVFCLFYFCFDLFIFFCFTKLSCLINQGQSWPWLYGSWIYNYLCNQCLSPLVLWVRISIRARCKTLHKQLKIEQHESSLKTGSSFPLKKPNTLTLHQHKTCLPYMFESLYFFCC